MSCRLRDASYHSEIFGSGHISSFVLYLLVFFSRPPRIQLGESSNICLCLLPSIRPRVHPSIRPDLQPCIRITGFSISLRVAFIPIHQPDVSNLQIPLDPFFTPIQVSHPGGLHAVAFRFHGSFTFCGSYFCRIHLVVASFVLWWNRCIPNYPLMGGFNIPLIKLGTNLFRSTVRHQLSSNAKRKLI
jgi:hypothetical protein